VPPLLLQPLVENSLKHGLKPECESLHMTLVASREDGWLTFTFADDGVANGRVANGNGSGGNGRAAGLGFGLGNLDQRVRRFGGRDASLAAGACEGGGFAVTLRWREGEGAEEQ
jgi:sensor histidine kinase YesM